jgi:hypothetical protein
VQFAWESALLLFVTFGVMLSILEEEYTWRGSDFAWVLLVWPIIVQVGVSTLRSALYSWHEHQDLAVRTGIR